MTFRDMRAHRVAETLKGAGVCDVITDYKAEEYQYKFIIDGEVLRACVPFCEFDLCSNTDIEENLARTIWNYYIAKGLMQWRD